MGTSIGRRIISTTKSQRVIMTKPPTAPHGVKLTTNREQSSLLELPRCEGRRPKVNCKSRASAYRWRYIRKKEVLLTNVRAGDYHIYPDHIRKIPVPMMDNVYAPKIVSMVDVALEAKQADSNADISSTEKNIDMLVYKLYELSYEEVVKVDSSITQSEYESFNPDEL